MILGLVGISLSSCSHITVLRTKEIKAESERVEKTLLAEIKAMRAELDSMKRVQSSSQLRLTADLDDVGKRVDRRGEHLNARLEEVESALTRLGQQVSRPAARRSVSSSSVDEISSSSALSSSSQVATLAVSSSAMKISAPVSSSVSAPSAQEQLFAKGRAEFAAARYKEAYKHFVQLFETDTTGLWREQALYFMAQCQELTGSAEKAQQVYAKLIQDYPKGGRFCASKWSLIRLTPEKNISERQAKLKELAENPSCQGTNEQALALDELKAD
jgi:TolA-binding protein